MNKEIERDSIIEYLSNLNPLATLEVARTSHDVKIILQALIGLSERLNSARKVKLLQFETARLRSEVESLDNEIKLASSLNDEREDLIKKRKKLLTEKETIDDLCKLKAEIEQLKEFVAKHNFSLLQKDIRQLQKGEGGEISHVNVFFQEADSFFAQLHSDFVKETKILLSNVSEKRQQVNTVVNDVRLNLENEQTNLSKVLLEYDKNFKEAYTNYEALAGQLSDIKSKLLEVKETHQKNVSNYQTHFEQNKCIYGELGKRHNIENHLSGLFMEIEKSLKKFDQEIKVLVEKADQLTIF